MGCKRLAPFDAEGVAAVRELMSILEEVFVRARRGEEPWAEREGVVEGDRPSRTASRPSAALTPWPRRRGAGRLAETGDEKRGADAPKPLLGKFAAAEVVCQDRRGEADRPRACDRFIEAGG